LRHGRPLSNSVLRTQFRIGPQEQPGGEVERRIGVHSAGSENENKWRRTSRLSRNGRQLAERTWGKEREIGPGPPQTMPFYLKERLEKGRTCCRILKSDYEW